jgi:uncharacterized protein (TIGR03435 family)
MKLLRTCVLIPFLASAICIGQTAPSQAFEVATVKPAAPLDMQKMAAEMQAGKMPRLGPHVDADRAEYTYMTLRDLLAVAYKMKGYQVSGPSWLTTDRFDIVAKLPDGASKDDAPAMLQTLLQERFKLAAHRDSSDHKVLALLVAKGAPKLQESPPAPAPVDEDAPLKPGEMKVQGPDGPIRVTRNPDGSATMNMGAKGIVTQKMDAQTRTMHITSSMVTMAGFAEMLTTVLQMGGGEGRQVVDQTGLKGNYQVAIDLSLADILAVARSQGMMPMGPHPEAPTSSGSSGASVPAASDPTGGMTVYQSVEALGLKLEDRNAKVDQLIIDHIEKTPTEN